jgi:hypothetical protein
VDNDELRGTFLYGLRQLHFNDDGLTDKNTLADLNTIALLSLALEAVTANGNTPVELAANRLAVLTEDLIATWIFPSKQAVHDWLIARAELLQLQIPGA